MNLGCNMILMSASCSYLQIYPNINDDDMLNIDELELTLCNDCDHTTNNDGVYIEN